MNNPQNNPQKSLAPLAFGLMLAAVIAVGASAYYVNRNSAPEPSSAASSNSTLSENQNPPAQGKNIQGIIVQDINIQAINTPTSTENLPPKNMYSCRPTDESSVKVLYPNGGVGITQGQTITAAWSACNLKQRMQLSLVEFPVSKNKEIVIGDLVDGARNRAQITIPDIVPVGKYVMKISTPPEITTIISDTSDHYFTVNSKIK